MIQTSKLHYLLQQLALLIIVTLTISVVNACENSTSKTYDAEGTITRSLTIDGQTISLNSSGQASFVARASASHKLVTLASDSQMYVSIIPT